MTDFVFDCALGKAAEKVADATTSIGLLLIKTAESDALMRVRTTITDLLSGSTEADFTNYARKTAQTGTLAINNTTHETTVDVADQTWTSAGGASNNTLAKLVVFINEGGTDATRIPLTAHDCVVTTDGSDLIAQIDSSGFYGASAS